MTKSDLPTMGFIQEMKHALLCHSVFSPNVTFVVVPTCMCVTLLFACEAETRSHYVRYGSLQT